MALKRPDLVLLDVDGTLVDTAPDLLFALNETFARFGLSPRGEAEVRGWIGGGVETLVQRALANEFDGNLDPRMFERMVPLCLEIYGANICRGSRLFPGVREGLDFLTHNGFHVGCVTNKRTRFTHDLLRGLGIIDEFDIILCGDTLQRKKPDPLPLLHAAEHFGMNPDRGLMVGDSTNDVDAARAAGFQVLCVTYGYNQNRDIRAARPDAVVDTLAELPRLFADA
jgi:phosphoglycolate phosphatase